MKRALLLAVLLLAGCSQQAGLRDIRKSFPGANVAAVPDEWYSFVMIYSGKVYYVESDGFVQPRTLTLDSPQVVQLFDDVVTVAVER